MFGLFKNKRKNEKILIYSVAKGIFLPLEQVKDDVFSKKMMGEGYAVLPESGEVYAPISGVVTSIFPSKHAIMIHNKEKNIGCLVHMGIDTVELEGHPFQVKVSEEDNILHGQCIAYMDLDYLKEHNKNNAVIVVFPNDEDIDFNIVLDVPDHQLLETKQIGYIE